MSNLILAIKAQADQFRSTVGDMDKDIKGLSRTTGEAQRTVNINWKKITVATAAVGGAFEAFARTQAETNTALSRVSAVTGETEQSLRDAAVAMSDYTFSTADAVRGMEDLISRGVRTREEMELILPAADTLADALGMDIVQAIDVADRALSALGIPLTEMEEHMDTITFLSSQTTLDMNNLGMAFRREAATIKDMGLSFDDVAVAMASLEAEGRRGPRAVMGLQTALKEAEGDVTRFWSELGVATDTLDTQREALANSAGMTKQFAETNNAAITPLQRVQAEIGNLLTRFGGMAEILGTLAPVMMAIGPTIGVIAGAKAALVPVIATLAAGFKALFFVLMANPFGLIIAALAAVGAAIYLLIKNWDEVVAFIGKAWDNITKVTNDMSRRVMSLIQTFVANIRSRLISMRDAALGAVNNMTGGVHDSINGMRRRAIQIIDDMIQGVKDRFFGMFSSVRDTVTNMTEGVTGLFSGMYNRIVGNSIVPDMAREVDGEFMYMSESVMGHSEAMAQEAIANFERMSSETGDVTQMWSTNIGATQNRMASDWSMVNSAMVDDTVDEFGRMRSGANSEVRSMGDVLMGSLNNFSGDWSSVVGDLVSGTVSSFQGMGQGVANVFGALFGSGKGSKSAAVGEAAGGLLGSIFGGSVGGMLGSAVGGSIGKGVRSIGKAFGFAKGGIVTQPTFGMLAEAGESEAVTPLSDFNAMMHGMYDRGAQEGGGSGEIRGMRRSMERLMTEVVRNTSRLVKIEDRWDRQGLPEARSELLGGGLTA